MKLSSVLFLFLLSFSAHSKIVHKCIYTLDEGCIKGFVVEKKKKKIDVYDIYKKLQKIVPCKIKITSGYRSSYKNEIVGGVHDSYHLKRGMAMDITCPCMNYKQLAKLIKHKANVIIYDTHLHFDLGKKRECRIKRIYGGYKICNRMLLATNKS